MKLNKPTFYLLSLTWGLPMTLIGAIVMLCLIITGKKPKKWGACYYIEVGKNWGGVNLGMFFLTSAKPTVHTRNHEHGHAIQNCFFGFLMLFIVCIPSAIRYWHRRWMMWRNLGAILPPYDSVWFERQATELGTLFVLKYRRRLTI